MLHFSGLRFLFVGLMLSLVVACSGKSGLLSDASNKQGTGEQQGSDNTAETSQTLDDGQVEQGVTTPRPIAADPMKSVTVPLALIKAYDEVTTAIKNNSPDEAIIKIKQLQTQYPALSGPSYRLARIYLDLKKYDEALDSVETAISINQNNYYAYNLKAIVLREKGEFEKSKQAYLKALEIYPDYVNGHLNLAILADIYLYDLALALTHFETYLLLTQADDKKVEGWVIDLKRRMPENAE